MELPELEAQLAALQMANQEREFNEGKKQFYDKFGTAFSNNDEVGLALLSRMAQNGIPMHNATMDVVQDVLTDMQQELNSFLSAIQINNSMAQDLVQKVQGMEQAITEVTGEALPPSAMPPPMPPPEAAPPPEGELPPEAAPPPEGELPPEAAPPPEGELPPEAAAPPTTPSDKRIKTILSDERLKRVKGEDRDALEAILAKYDEEPIEEEIVEGEDIDGDGVPDYAGDPYDDDEVDEEIDIGDDGLGIFQAALARPGKSSRILGTSTPVTDPYDVEEMARILASVQ